MLGGFLLFATALVVTLTAEAVFLRLLGHRVIDDPNHRSSHAVPTPRIGGLGVLAGLLVALGSPGTVPVVASGLALGLLGFRDDLRPLAPLVRLMSQVLLASMAVVVLGDGPIWMVIILSLFVVAYINAFNFMDGLNGISALNVLVVGGSLAVAGLYWDVASVTALGVVFCATSLGFLPFNVRGKVFLGDVGSYAYGAVLSVTCVLGLTKGIPWPVLLGPLVIYLADTGYTLLRRLWRRENLFEAHRDHVYQRLQQRGCGHLGSSIVTSGFSLLTAVNGWIVAQRSPVFGFGLCALAVVAYLALPSLIQANRRSPPRR